MSINTNEYKIETISKTTANTFLAAHHYLSKAGYSFRSGNNYGLYKGEKLIGVAVFHGPSVPETAQSCFGLTRTEQQGIWELGRLAVDDESKVKNLTSWFLSRCIKQLRKDKDVRAILTYADTDYHKGFIYQALNFKYYGLSAPKKDFWVEQADGSFKKQSRGKTSGVKGEWRPRSRKHRYVLVYDKSLKVKWCDEPYPKS